MIKEFSKNGRANLISEHPAFDGRSRCLTSKQSSYVPKVFCRSRRTLIPSDTLQTNVYFPLRQTVQFCGSHSSWKSRSSELEQLQCAYRTRIHITCAAFFLCTVLAALSCHLFALSLSYTVKGQSTEATCSFFNPAKVRALEFILIRYKIDASWLNI